MPVLQRKRRADAQPTPSPPPARRRRSGVHSDDAEHASGSDHEESLNVDGAEEEANLTAGAHQQMVKKLVRLALATEYARQPLRRTDINAKVLAPNASSRNTFKTVLADAQTALRRTFGMELRELPLKDRVTIQQKRAAHRAAATTSSSTASSSHAYILTSTLPGPFRTAAILPPARVPDVATEAAATGFHAFVVGLISLSEGQRVSEATLLRHLRTCHADELVLNGERTEAVLRRCERQGYVLKIKERDGAGGEESVEYVVGPRGKLEIGARGVAGLVRSVYGKRDAELEELEDRLEASLGVGTFTRRTATERAAAPPGGQAREDEEQQQQRGTTQAAGAATAGDAPGASGRRSSTRRTQADYGRTRQTRRTAAAAPAESEEDDDEEDSSS